ncbi:MAG: 50S ribosomal protein L6 [Parcubacteria group bacterium Gr01-1014_72]|nr:MAG: 50S ribosomal protein L6 [Parcubacteria group bacterium Gr01-1014_72]
MSRLAKRPLEIPSGVTVTLAGGVVTTKGPAGIISRPFRDDVSITIGEKAIELKVRHERPKNKALLGTYAAHLRNMMMGVAKPFEKRLIIEGIGFKSEVKGGVLALNLGFSHPVAVSIPEGLTVTAEKNLVTVKGSDKELVGDFAARTRARKPAEPYKGKGIRYEGEVIRRKQGKKATAAA